MPGYPGDDAPPTYPVNSAKAENFWEARAFPSMDVAVYWIEVTGWTGTCLPKDPAITKMTALNPRHDPQNTPHWVTLVFAVVSAQVNDCFCTAPR